MHGGASGIGTHAIQVARALGARVAVTAGSTAKLDFCRELGAEILINYHDEDFVERVKEASDGAGADVIFDIMGASYLDRNIDALATEGRLVIIGMQGGIKGELNIAKLLSKRAHVIGTTLRGRPTNGPNSKSEVVAAVTESVWPMIADGRVRANHRGAPTDSGRGRGAPTAAGGRGDRESRADGLAPPGISPARRGRAPTGRPQPSSNSAPDRR